jgi:hypothetical protein
MFYTEAILVGDCGKQWNVGIVYAASTACDIGHYVRYEENLKENITNIMLGSKEQIDDSNYERRYYCTAGCATPKKFYHCKIKTCKMNI